MAYKVTNESIDVRILRLLELEDVFDLDYDTYLTLLKEALVKGSFGKTKLAEEELALLANERKRVRGKKGRFSPKEKKISTASFAVGRLKGTTQKLLPGKAEAGGSLIKIDKTLDSIISTLSNQNKILDEKSKLDRKEKENRKRKEKESLLEKPVEGIKKAIEVVTKPFKSILDKIIDFFVITLLGRAVYKLIEWFGDAKNKEKIDLIGRFLKDWWPALLGAYILFGTNFGKFVRGLTRMVIGFTFKLAKFAIPKLLAFAKSHPLLAAGATIGLATLGAEMFRQKEESSQVSKEAQKRNVKPEQVQQEVNQAKNSPFAMFGEAMQNIGTIGFSGGGMLSRKNYDLGGKVSGPGGVDNVPAWLTDGEFVISKGAVNKYGVSFFESLNAAGGGTNVPTVIGNQTFAAGGGLIGQKETAMEGMSGLRPSVPSLPPMPGINVSNSTSAKPNVSVNGFNLNSTGSKGSIINFPKINNTLNIKSGPTLNMMAAMMMPLLSSNNNLFLQNSHSSRQNGGTSYNGTVSQFMMGSPSSPKALPIAQRAPKGSGITPPTKKLPKVVFLPVGGAGKQSGSSSSSNTVQKDIPSFSPIHRDGTRTTEAVLGIKKT